MDSILYFSHDVNARNDSKLMQLRFKYGMQGIGIFWSIVEMLYEEGGYINISEYERISYELRENIECITDVIENFNLFKIKKNLLYSESVLCRLQKRMEKSEKAKASINARWQRYERNTNVIPEKYERNTNKDKVKVKEKENSLSPPLRSGDLNLEHGKGNGIANLPINSPALLEEKVGTPPPKQSYDIKSYPHFADEKFRTAWEEWGKHRKEIRHSLTPTTIKKQLNMLHKYTIEESIQMINCSIEKGWQGLFDSVLSNTPHEKTNGTNGATYFQPKQQPVNPLRYKHITGADYVGN